MELKQVNSKTILPILQTRESAQNKLDIQPIEQLDSKNDNFPFDFEILEAEEISHPVDLGDTSSEHFITSNTEAVNLENLRDRCIIPVFSKDNESTISHPEFINTVAEIGNNFFAGERIEPDRGTGD